MESTDVARTYITFKHAFTTETNALSMISILKRTKNDIHLRDYVRHAIWDNVKMKFISF